MEQIITGLTPNEVVQSREKFGANIIPSKKSFVGLKIFLGQFKSPLVYVLLIAALITYFLKDYVDTGVIMFAVVVNTLLGFIQEYRAEKGLEALKTVLAPKVLVIREGEEKEISASELVVGDILFLTDLHKVGADGVIIEEDGLFCDEAVLTGESIAVEKLDYKFEGTSDNLEFAVELKKKFGEIDGKHKVYMGTRVVVGVAKVLVTAVGKETEVGKIAVSLRETEEEETPLQLQVKVLATRLAILVGLVSLAVLIVGLLAGEKFVDIFPTTVALAVSAIPEGLVVSLTVILAIGMQRILRQKAVVRKLTAAETLGSVDVICADKTGTLTEGVMRVNQALYSLDNKDESKKQDILKAAILCNDARDPLEIGMRDWAVAETDKKTTELWDKESERLDSIPFSSDYRYIATLNKEGKETVVWMSGAPETIIERSKLTPDEKVKWEKKFWEFATKGYRIVGFAKKKFGLDKKKVIDKDLHELEWLGILIYEDPVRKGVQEVVKEVMKAGISVKVITGDHKQTAAAIVRQIGLLPGQLGDAILTGDELEKMSDVELGSRVDAIVLFARIKPEQKLRIVDALQKKGHVVAMTGDGVNDAPALKTADIGIVVNDASDVSKETADLVLLDNNFATIVGAVEEGRGIYDNLKKIIIYLLSDAFAEILVVVVSLMLRWPLPILATQILWINLISDGFPSLALTIEPKEKGILKQMPRKKSKQLMDGQVVLLIGLISIVAAVMTLFAFGWFWHSLDYGLIHARTVAFTMLGVCTLFYVFSCRSISEPIWKVDFLRNPWLIVGVVFGFVLQLMVVYVPILQNIFETVALGWFEWLVIIIASLLLVVTVEIVKFAYYKK